MRQGKSGAFVFYNWLDLRGSVQNSATKSRKATNAKGHSFQDLGFIVTAFCKAI
jgi:hypothetical protein